MINHACIVLLLSAFAPLPSLAETTVDPGEPRFQAMIQQSPVLLALRESFRLENCLGYRHGRQFAHLAGTSRGPYSCELVHRTQTVPPAEVSIETEVTYLGEDGRETNDEFGAYDFNERAGQIHIRQGQ